MIKKYSAYKNNSFFNLKSPHPEKGRLRILEIAFLLFASLICIKLGELQILEHRDFEAFALKNRDFYQKLSPKRGEIFIRDPYSQDGWHKIAVNQDLSLMYVNPWQVVNQSEAAEKLGPILNLSVDELNEKLKQRVNEKNQKDTYEIIKRKVSAHEKKAVEDLNIKGIGFTQESWRYYPDKDYTAHISGFLGMASDEKIGQYGLEGYFDNELAGESGVLRFNDDSSKSFFSFSDSLITEAKDGEEIYLTVDKNIQFYACETLKKKVEETNSKEGTVIIMQPETGAIIANCSYPSYDPNNYSSVESAEVYIDKALIPYEPGSVFKAFSVGAAIDMGKINPYTTYNDTGEIWVEGWNKPLKNSHGSGNGIVDMSYVLEQSLNTGAIFAVQQVGNEAWYDYVRKFGFGEKTGIELAGEYKGDISALEKFQDIYSATSSYGQGIMITPMQLVAAFGAIANDGVLMKPFIVAEKGQAQGLKEATQPQKIREVFSPQTAHTLSAMLVNVVDKGTAKGTIIDGYYIGGKTGTAQVPLPNGSYDANRHKDTFVGIAPISSPKFIMLAKLDEPQGVAWAESSVVPLWHEIAEYLINYYQIPPDRE